jgi:hypothetical protein
VSVPEHRVRWPNSESAASDSEQYRKNLKQSLARTFDLLGDPTVAALVALDKFRRTPCVVIHHDIELAHWSSATSALLEWYLNDYWGALEPDATRATILILIKLSCPPSMSAASKLKLLGRPTSAIADLRGALDRIVAVNRPGCRRLVIDELCSVTRYDVKQWFANYGIYRSEEERIEETNRLFGVGTPNEVESLPMTIVEKRLMQIHESITRSTGERVS